MRKDAIRRYADGEVPRYTSYPTAPHFSAEVDEAVYRGWLAAVPTDASLSLYLHVLSNFVGLLGGVIWVLTRGRARTAPATLASHPGAPR